MQPLQICIGPTIRFSQESWCLPYAVFFCGPFKPYYCPLWGTLQGEGLCLWLWALVTGDRSHKTRDTWHATALSLNAEAFTNNRTFQAVEPEKLTRKCYMNKSCALLGTRAYIWRISSKIIKGMQIYIYIYFYFLPFFLFWKLCYLTMKKRWPKWTKSTQV